jgi:drug/metabolite transporter (DMT)-like permease
VAPATAAMFRCLYALPFLAGLAWLESRKSCSRGRRERLLAAAAGVFFAVELVLWHHAIALVGAGIATVLCNLQVVFVGFIAWCLLGERPTGRLMGAVPIVLVGIVLISGIVGQNAYGSEPLLGVVFGLGASAAYAGFILLLREGTRDQRRVAGPLLEATAVAAAASAALGPVSGGLDLIPALPAHGWLVAMALSAQVAGWLLISFSLPRLPAAVTSLMLLLQPLISLLLAGVVLGERPSALQLVGCGIVLIGVVLGARGHPGTQRNTAVEPPPVASSTTSM